MRRKKIAIPPPSAFKGTFDGGGHSISGINTTGRSALFQVVNGATIKNLTIKDSLVTSSDSYVGAFAATSDNSKFENCTNEATINGTKIVGGIVGNPKSTEFLDCTNNGSVTGGNQVGGIAGFSSYDCIFTRCVNNGTITSLGNDGKAGGIIGQSDHDAFVNCYNTGEFVGAVYGGGIAGTLNTLNSSVPSTGLFNYQEATGSYSKGGLTGFSYLYYTFRGVYYHIDKLASGATNQSMIAPKQKPLEAFQNGEVAYLLNTDDSKAANSGTWSQGVDHPVFADGSTFLATQRITFTDVDGTFKYAYTQANGSVVAPAFNNVASWQDAAGNAVDLAGPFTADTTVFAVAKPPFEGAGTDDAPYRIETAEQLSALSQYTADGNAKFANKCWKLMDDITFDSTQTDNFAAIGTSTAPFTGTFDGNGRTISGINTTGSAALFGETGSATIKNLVLADTVVNNASEGAVGAFAGKANGTTFEGCTSSGTVGGNANAGGFVGNAQSSSFTDCTNTGAVTGANGGFDSVGGIAGRSTGSTFSRCVNAGSLTALGKDGSAGGISGVTGTSGDTGAFTACYNTGTITGTSVGGGIAATLNGTYDLNDLFNLEEVSTSPEIQGGIIGLIYDSATVRGGGYYHVDRTAAGKGLGNSLANGQKTLDAFASGEVAWLLNTKGGTEPSSATWCQDATHPDFAGDGAIATCRISFKTVDGSKLSPVFTRADGTIDLPALDHTDSWRHEDGTTAASGDVYAQDEILTAIGPFPFEGAGTAEDPYEIGTPEQLALLSKYTAERNDLFLDKSWELISDIAFDPSQSNNFTAIGTFANTGDNDRDQPFSGSFEGNGHTIKGLAINQYDSADSIAQGLFASIENARISNVIVEGCTIEGTYLAGGIAGQAKNSTITACTSKDNRISTKEQSGGSVPLDGAGGIAGYLADGTSKSAKSVGTAVSNCFNDSSVIANLSPGGIVGEFESHGGTVANCFNNTADIRVYDTSVPRETGAIIGWNKWEDGCSNNFFLEAANLSGGYNPSGPAPSTGTTSATEAQIENGEVAYLLQKANSEYVWGQKLNSEGKTTPWLYAKPQTPPDPGNPDPTPPLAPEQVFQVTFVKPNNDVVAVLYTNNKGDALVPPALPRKYRAWNVTDFGNVTSDLTVTALENTLTAAAFEAIPAVPYNGTAQEPALTAADPTLTADDFTVTFERNKDVGTAKATATATEHGNFTGSVTLEFAIEQQALTPQLAGVVAPKAYDGKTDVETPALAFDGLAAGESLVRGTDYEETAAFDDAEVGTGKAVTVAVKLLDTAVTRNYALASDTLSATGDIVKAVPAVASWPSASIVYGQQLKDAALDGGEGSLPGSFAWEDETVVPDGANLAHTMLFQPDDADHYAAVPGPIEVELRNATPQFTELASSIEYGQTLKDAALAGTGTNPHNGVAVSGTWSWQDDGARPAQTGSYPAAFAPISDEDGKTHYDPAIANVTVQVNETTPVIAIDLPTVQIRGQKVTVHATAKNPHDSAFADRLPQEIALSYRIGDGAEIPFDGAFTIPADAAPNTEITVTATTEAVPGAYRAASQTAVLRVTDKNVIDPSRLHLTQDNLTYGSTPNPSYRLDGSSSGNAAWTVLYSADGGATFASDTPRNAGSYLVKAVYEDDTNQGETTIGFKIEPRDLVIGVILSKTLLNVGEALPTAALSYEGLLENEQLTPDQEAVFAGFPADSAKAGTYTVRWANRDEMLQAIEALDGAANYRISVTDTAAFSIKGTNGGGIPDPKPLPPLKPGDAGTSGTPGDADTPGDAGSPSAAGSASTKTGDSTAVFAWIALLAASAGIMIAASVRMRKQMR